MNPIKKITLGILLIAGIMAMLSLSCQKGPAGMHLDQILSGPWYIQSSIEVQAEGDVISNSDFDYTGWYQTKAPKTVLAALVQNKVFEDPYFGKNMEKISREPFQNPWWYRTEFEVNPEGIRDFHRLIFEGINYRADVWLNGKKIAGSDSIVNAFRIYKLDISKKVEPGKNILAVKVHPPKPGNFTIGFVDWNPRPPDENMGIWRPVKLRTTGPVSIENAFIQTEVNLETLKEAALTITMQLVNHSNNSVTGIINGNIEGRRVQQDYSLSPKESKQIEFTPDQYPTLQIENPELWWPNNLGDPHLYDLDLTVRTQTDISDMKQFRFGIREVDDYMNEAGHRGYKINGKKVQIKGGGWVDDLMLADDDRRVEAQIRYAKQMNLNTLRLEGFWGNSQKLYDLADQYGILLMVGWSCHWEWTGYLGKTVGEYMGIETPKEMVLMSQSYMDQVLWLRNHPSIFVWVFGSDKLLLPELEKDMVDRLGVIDPTRPILASCQMLNSAITGSTGVKMYGPYAYVPPNYWWEDKEHGGAYGFNTETGPGAQPPPVVSIKKMLPPDKWWPVNELWDYHCARNEFGSLNRYRTALDKRYGPSVSVDEFAIKAQLANYEAMRGMFEAFAVNKHNATGVIQWMYNSAWPAMYWQLYDWYLMPNGAFYGAQTACEPVNLIYNYGDDTIHLINDKITSVDDLFAEIKIWDLNSQILIEERLEVQAEPNSSSKIVDLPKLENLTDVYFLDLKLLDQSGQLIEDNFYWLSKRKDILDYPNSEWFVTPIKKYADFTALKSMPQVELDVTHHFHLNGQNSSVHVTLNNPTDRIAFFVELLLVSEESGESVLPIFWDDNYVSLLPSETKQISAAFNEFELDSEKPILKYSGINVKQ